MDFRLVDSSRQSTPSMRCRSTPSSLRRFWSSSLVVSSLAHPGDYIQILCVIHSTDIPSAFNAIISASVVALGVSYAIPPAINCLRGRKMLPPRPFVLPGPLGWICNLLGIAYVIVTTVLFLFPPTLPVTGSNMSTSSFFLSLSLLCALPYLDVNNLDLRQANPPAQHVHLIVSPLINFPTSLHSQACFPSPSLPAYSYLVKHKQLIQPADN